MTTRRSLQASPEGIEKARRALAQNSLTQKALAEEELKMSRHTVDNFFKGRRVDRRYFIQICERLNLEWDEIVAKPPSKPEAGSSDDNDVDIDALVQEVRKKIKPSLQDCCGTMRVLDMSQPIGLNDIYTNVNILEKITGRQRKEVAELLQEFNLKDFDRFGLGRISEERVPGLKAVEKYNKLLILGKPGAGKTTFLKYLAIQCNSGNFQADLVPIFVTLKEFAEVAKKLSLLEYITQQFSACGVMDTQVAELFNQSKALVLLDGLDEVREEDNSRVLKEIRDLSNQFRDNHFVMTCRIAARDYTFEKFTEVEVADFDDEQIATFAINWFKNKAVKSETFIKRLTENSRIKELATNPLLLTLLCLVFEGSLDFPANRSELYEEGLEALLKKWDAGRGIERDQVYKKLSLKRKEELLSKIALTTFERADYLFKQKVAKQYITDYIRNLPDANTNPEALQLDSEVVLRSIEAQHGLLVERAKGIYSFSHLTFHEYFTAREIVFGTQPLEKALLNLITHITEKRWWEVFFLAVGMLPSADSLLLLMKQQVDTLVAAEEKLQQFLMWVKEKSASVDVDYKPAAVRAFYLTLAVYHVYVFDFGLALGRAIDQVVSDAHDLACAIDFCFDSGQTNNIISDLSISFAILCGHSTASPDDTFEPVLAQALFLTSILGCDFALERGCFLIPELNQLLQQPRDQLSKSGKQIETFKEWWQANGQAWTEQLRAVMIEHRNIGHDWQFSDEQKELLEQYYDANRLLLECLNSDCYVSLEVRQEIEDTLLLLPITEIEQRQE